MSINRNKHEIKFSLKNATFLLCGILSKFNDKLQ